MKTRTPMLNAVKPWLAEFLLLRGLWSGPDGKPLYAYQVSAEEFSSLKSLLSDHKGLSEHAIYQDTWAAGYCLYVAERYRRQYEAGVGGWSWSEFDKELGCDFTPQQKSTLVEKGLVNYWKRSIRVTSQGRDMLGSLFAEGGLPWLLVQSEDHGFGRAVRRGLKHAYSEQSAEITVVDLLARYEEELPQPFQNIRTRQILAGIVQSLVKLVSHYDLESHKDPAGHLDEVDPTWRGEFPIPLDATNAKTLINDWLILAGHQQKSKKEKVDRARWFTCEHQLEGDGESWTLRADVFLPNKEDSYAVDHIDLASTRLQIAFFEGDNILARGGVVYGRLEDQKITIRFPQTKVSLTRKDLESQITLKLLANGQEVLSQPIADSELDLHRAPLVFSEVGDEAKLVANESCSIKQSKARIRLPVGATYACGEHQVLAQDSGGAQWIEIASDAQIQIDSELYLVLLGAKSEHGVKPYISGEFHRSLNALPNTVYLGWPNFNVPQNSPHKAGSLEQFVNGQALVGIDTDNYCGSVDFIARGEKGSVVLRRKFGVLPTDFSMTMVSGYNDQPASVILKSKNDFDVSVSNSEVRVEHLPHKDGRRLNLHLLGSDAPNMLHLRICSRSNPNPISIKAPYPTLSASLVDENDRPFDSRDLSVDEMLGKRIILCSGTKAKQRFNIRLRLMGAVSPQPAQDFYVTIGQMPTELNLYNYQNDVERMLAAAGNQDAVVHVAVSSVTQLLYFNIRRYNGLIEKNSREQFSIRRHSSFSGSGRAIAEAMLLSDPRRSPIVLPALRSEGVNTGSFEVMPEMEKASPWLIYPSEQSDIQFRPELFIGSNAKPLGQEKISSLHLACQTFHPKLQPEAINDQIAMMAHDLGHSGWQYLADLKQRYSHLPLSSFEAWISLTKNPEALAVAIYRLELDESFCNRIRDELSTFWECIHLNTWRSAYVRFLDWFSNQGLPESLVNEVIISRHSALVHVVPGFQEFSDYIKTGDVKALRQLPVGVVTSLLCDWYQNLRRVHEANDHWPEQLSKELTRWMNARSLPDEIKKLSVIPFTHAVTYIPIFMAHVTVGKCELSDLHESAPFLKHAISQLSEFDRVGWYNCTHGMMVNYLMLQSAEKDDL